MATVLLLSGCSTVGYYSHLAVGEAGILLHRKSIESIITRPDTDADLRQRLRAVLHARRFATTHLDLPDNRSYTYYTDLDRPYVMYNVYATPALSLKPIEHCFLFAGCVAYQGFYKRERAENLAAELRRKGDDVYVSGVPAYSTLGHFADPVLSTMNRWSRRELIGTIFHELAHQKLYVKGDTTFNESLATFVQHKGLEQWRQATDQPPPDRTQEKRRRQFTQLILATRRRLTAIYASDRDDLAKRARKLAAFEQLRRNYRHLRDTRWHGDPSRDDWFNRLNNAKLLPFGLYDQYTDAFAALYKQCDGDWSAFYQRAGKIADRGAETRRTFLHNGPGALPDADN